MKKGWQIVLILAVLTVTAGGVSPVRAGEEPLARVSAGTAGIEWLSTGSYERLILTVSSPDGTVLRREFRAGETPSFSLFDAQGVQRPDGTYTWELQAVPKVPKWVKERVAAAREAGDDAALEALRKSGRMPQGKIQSGTFGVAGGSVVAQDAAEPPAQSGVRKATSNSGLTPTAEADQVIPDDLIVQGSLCVGFDCVNNESFGFDTIRLKENNTRIKFEDTSVGTFPTNDWQLTANDSASGGSSKFSIEDITGAKVPFTITAGASTNSIFVDSTGRVGFRTSTPVLDLHVATSNTPAIRLEQNNSGGFTAQTWDIAGNEANFFVRDVTSGSRLPFRIRPGAPTSSIDISADGDVGVGTASPAARLHVSGAAAGAEVLRIQNTDAAGFSGINIIDDTSTNVFFIGHDNSGNANRLNSTGTRPLLLMTEGAERVRINTAGDVGIHCDNPTGDLHIATTTAGCAGAFSRIDAGATQFTNASSRTLKTNLSAVKVPSILDKIAEIPVYHYDYIQGPKDRIGLIAEDFHNVFGRGSDKYIQGDEVQMALWLAVQELAAQNKELMQRLGTMEAQLTALQGKAPELFAAVKAALAAQEETAP